MEKGRDLASHSAGYSPQLIDNNELETDLLKHFKICVAPSVISKQIKVVTKDLIQFDLPAKFVVGFNDLNQQSDIIEALSYLCEPHGYHRDRAIEVLEIDCNNERITKIIEVEVCKTISTMNFDQISGDITRGTLQ